MNIFETILNGMESIYSNKLRTSLSMLGIIIGVGSVVILNSIGKGSQESIVSNLESMGVNLITVSSSAGGSVYSQSSSEGLDYDVVEYLRENVSNIKGVSGESSGSKQLIYGGNNTSARVLGVDTEYLTVNDLELEYGNFITQDDIDKMKKVAVIGVDVLESLFENQNPVGKKMKVGDSVFEVIGILKETGGQKDYSIIIPYSTAQIRLFGDKTLSSIYIATSSSDEVDTVQTDIENILLTYFGETDIDDASFSVENRSDMLERVSEITGTMTLLLSGIAAISLIVGGIGIMNIMLVSVTERTKEIGIRKAIGAKKNDILLQFLVESSLLSIFGGAIGVLISFVAVYLISSYGISAVMDYESITLALGFSLFVGIFFGLLPAYKAAGLRPIDALRFE